MTNLRGERLYVTLSASAVRKRLEGHGFGVRRIENAGRGRAVIIHTATGKHLEQLRHLFHNVLEATTEEQPPESEFNPRNQPAGENGI